MYKKIIDKFIAFFSININYEWFYFLKSNEDKISSAFGFDNINFEGTNKNKYHAFMNNKNY